MWGVKSLGEPVGEAGADALGDGEELELLAQLAVVAALGLLQALDDGVELLLGGGGDAVEALEHLVVLVAAVVAAGHAHELDGADAAAVLHVGAAAEVDVVAGAVDGDGLALGDVGQALELVGLVLEELLGLGAGELLAHEGQLGADELAHGLLDGREVLRAQAVGQVKVVVKAVVGRRPDVDLHVLEQRTHRGGHQVGRAVPDLFNRRAHVCSLIQPCIIQDSGAFAQMGRWRAPENRERRTENRTRASARRASRRQDCQVGEPQISQIGCRLRAC